MFAFKTSLFVLGTAICAAAQSISIHIASGTDTLVRGAPNKISLFRTDSTNVTEVGIAITVKSCPAPCSAPSASLGDILYVGAYKPQIFNGAGPYENFTVYVPASLTPGDGVLTVVHTALVAGGPFVFNEQPNMLVNLQ